MSVASMRIAEISLPAIRHNVRHVRELTGVNVIAVMKANAYGHGTSHVARAALEAGAMMIGVADIDEAVELRAAGIDAPVLCWLIGAHSDFGAAVEHGIEVGVSRIEQLESLAEAASRIGRAATLQLKIDTGLSRNGAEPERWEQLFSRAIELEREGHVRVRGIFSHLSNAGEAADAEQGARLDAAVALLRRLGCDPELVHLAASEAALTRPSLHYNTVRVGMAMYGLSSFTDRTSADFGLIPAMTLKSELVGLRHAPAGTGVSYEFTHVTERDALLGLVPLGYADGLPRGLSGTGTTVLVSGVQCPIVGRIAMDQCVVDLSELVARGIEVRIGDEVVLFGDPSAGLPPVEAWARAIGTINYEIVASIGSRVVRVAIDDEEPAAAPAAPAASASGASRVVHIEDPDAMHRLGVELGRSFTAGDLIILTGPLGAGKTTLSRGIGEGLGVRGPVTSPTFVLARTHPSTVGGAPLIHVDAYRLADAAELDDLDLDFDGSVVVAEWGAGLIEERGSWIEIVIERPLGGTVAGAGRAGQDDAANGGAANGDHGGHEDPEDPEELDELIEPRTVTITGYGPRYQEGFSA